MSPRRSRTAVIVSTCALVLSCAFGESTTPELTGGDSAAGSSGATAQAGSASTPAASGGSSAGTTAGSASNTAGTGFAAAGTGFGTAGTGSAGSGGGSAGSAGAGGRGNGGVAGTGTAGNASAGSGTAGTGVVTPAECPTAQGAEMPLPLTVSGNFIPSGYFAGPAANVAGIVQAPCEARPAAHTLGDCYKFTFQASVLEGAGAYAGVFWQHGANNWGTGAGLKVAPGATKVTFKAWSGGGGELIEFSAGGIGSSATLCADQLSLGQGNGTKVTLTNTPTQYTIDLQGQTYAKGVIGGFVWSASVSTVDQVLSFYVDEIQWLK